MFAPTNPNAVLNDLLGEEHTVFDLAAHHNTTPVELAAWLETPDIAKQFNALMTLAAARARAVATNALHAVARAMHEIVGYFNDVQMHCVYNPTNPKDADRRLRQFQTVRRAAWILYLISRTSGEPPRPRPARTDPPKSPHEPSTRPPGARTFVLEGAATPSSSTSRAIDVARATSMPDAPLPHAVHVSCTTNKPSSSAPSALESRATTSPASALFDNSSHTLTPTPAAPYRPP